MPTPKFAAWLRVVPPPTTISESSAILKHLKTQGHSQGQSQGNRQAQGRVKTFIRAKTGHPYKDKDKTSSSSDSATYYTTFTYRPTPQTFSVPVHHNHTLPHTLDPFNIRGLKDRKPHPQPTTFTCTLEPASSHDASTYAAQIKKENPYHGSFRVAFSDWLQDVYGETGAPPGAKQALGVQLSESEAADERKERDMGHGGLGTNNKLKMNSLMRTWREAVGMEKENAQLRAQTPIRVQRSSQKEREDKI